MPIRHQMHRHPDRLYNPASDDHLNELSEGLAWGEYVLLVDKDGEYHWACIWVPGTPTVQVIPLRPHQSYRNGASWHLASAYPLTLQPSINWVGVWHGWITEGQAWSSE